MTKSHLPSQGKSINSLKINILFTKEYLARIVLNLQ